ncbi:MAG: hypothetical protein ACLQM8_03580 [Limisphaerales bacterium]
MNTVFADTFYFVARLNRRDQHHERVLAGALTGDKHFEQAGFAALLK